MSDAQEAQDVGDDGAAISRTGDVLRPERARTGRAGRAHSATSPSAMRRASPGPPPIIHGARPSSMHPDLHRMARPGPSPHGDRRPGGYAPAPDEPRRRPPPQAVRDRRRPRRPRVRGARPARSSASSAPTARARPRRCGSRSACCEPTPGRVTWRGTESHRAAARRPGATCPEERGLYPRMTVLDQLVFFAGLHGVPAGRGEARGDGLAAPVPRRGPRGPQGRAALEGQPAEGPVHRRGPPRPARCCSWTSRSRASTRST